METMEGLLPWSTTKEGCFANHLILALGAQFWISALKIYKVIGLN